MGGEKTHLPVTLTALYQLKLAWLYCGQRKGIFIIKDITPAIPFHQFSKVCHGAHSTLLVLFPDGYPLSHLLFEKLYLLK